MVTGPAPIPAVMTDLGMGGAGPAIGFGRLQLFVLLDLQRPYELAELRRAVSASAARIPVLGCRYELGFWRDRWIPAPEAAAEAVEQRPALQGLERATRELLTRQLDPTTGWPWQVVQLVAGDAARLVLLVLHQVADGAGAISIAQELGRQLEGAGGEDPPFCTDRGLPQVLRALRLRDLPALSLDVLREMARPLALPLVGRTAERWREPATEPTPGLYLRRLSIGPESPLRQRCRALDCTVNDALVAAMAELARSLSVRGLVGAFFTVDLRRYLRDEQPRVANLSGFDMLLLPRREVAGLASTARAVARRTRRLKARFAGLPTLLAAGAWAWPWPFALQRSLGRVATRWIRALSSRGLLITNIGNLDPYLAPWGERLQQACVVGPFLRGASLPAFTATSFRQRLTVVVDAYEPMDPGRGEDPRALLERLDRLLCEEG